MPKGIPERTETLRRKDIRNLYIPKGFEVVWEKFKQICEREGATMSDKIRFMVQEYVRVHEPGNPQLLLERFTGAAAEPLPRYLTCRHSRKALARGEFYCNRFAFWKIPVACERCDWYWLER